MPDKVKVELFTVTDDGAKLKHMGDSIIARFTKTADDLHIWAVSAVLHAIKHGDYTEIPRICDKLSERGFRSNALRAWFCHAKLCGGMPLKWILKDGDAPAHFELDAEKRKAMLERYEADADAFIALLSKEPYWKTTKESEFKGFDLEAKLAALYKEATKILADEKRKDNPKNNFKKLAGLQRLVAESGASALN